MCRSHVSDMLAGRSDWHVQSVLQYILVLPITLFLNFISFGSFLDILNILGQNNSEKEHLWTNVERTDCILRTGEYLKYFFFFELCFLKVIYCKKIQSQLNVNCCFICIL